MDLASLRRYLNPKISQRNQAIATLKQEQINLQEAERLVQHTLTAQECVQEVAQQLQQESHKQIAKVVSKCLSAVFQEPYELRIEFERRRGRTEAEFVYLRNGRKVDPKLTSGGVMDVTTLALRLASLIMTLPPSRKLLIQDEPFKGLSAINLQKMSMLIESLNKDLGVDFLLVTHDPELRIGKVIEFK